MSYDMIVGIIVYLAAGWLFTVWFVHCFLENESWADAGKVGPVSLILINVVWIGFALVLLIFGTIALVSIHTGDAIRALYGVRK